MDGFYRRLLPSIAVGFYPAFSWCRLWFARPMRPATPRPRAPPPPPSAMPLRPTETSTPPAHGISSDRGPAPAQHANPPAGSAPALRPPPPVLRPPPQHQQWPPLPTGPPPGTTGHEPPVGHAPPAGSYASPSQCGAASHSPCAMPMQPVPPAQQLHMHGGWGQPPFFTQPFCDSAGQLYTRSPLCTCRSSSAACRSST